MDLPAIRAMSLCTGGGGLDLGLRLAVPAARTVCYVENEATAIQVLVRRMQEGFLDQAPVWTDLRSFDGVPWRGAVDLLLGGYPCQPWSVAGRRRGKDDPRHLWPVISKLVSVIRPGLCFFENVSNHLNFGFDEIEAELREMGYVVEAGLFSAAEVGSPHLRRRLFILARLVPVANPVGFGEPRGDQRRPAQEGQEASKPEDGQEVADELGDGSEAMGDPAGARRVSGEPGQGGEVRDEARRQEPERRGRPVASVELKGRAAWGDHGDGKFLLSPSGRQVPVFPPRPDDLGEWSSILQQEPSIEPAVRDVADGVAHGVGERVERRRADQIRLLGNGVLPATAALAFLSLLNQSENGY